MEDSVSVECSNCGFVFQNEELTKPRENWEPCPQCGSLRRNVRLTHREALKLYESHGLKAKKPTSRHSKKNRVDYEFVEGERFGRNGRLVYGKTKKDREHPDLPDSYVETVKDKDGKIIIDKHEKLSEHKES